MNILPTRGRPDGLQRFFDEGKPEQPGIVVFDEDDWTKYIGKVSLPDNWRWIIAPTMSGLVKKYNLAFEFAPNESWYSYCSDDAVGRTAHWDTILAENVTPKSLVWPNDLIHGTCTQPFIGGDLCRALGFLCHPAFNHLYVDHIWFRVTAALKICHYMPNVILEHLHFSTGKSKYDQTSKERNCEGDKAIYEALDLQPLIEKIRQIL